MSNSISNIIKTVKKIIKVLLIFFMFFSTLFFVIGITDKASKSIKKRNVHNQELLAELRKYSNVLDIDRTKIKFAGSGYYFFSSSMPRISLSLYLKHDYNSCEKLIEIRNKLIVFFINNNWEKREKYAYPELIRRSRNGLIPRGLPRQ